MKQLLSILVALFLLGAGTNGVAGGQMVQIKFIPVEMNTYFPVTKQVIAERYDYYGEFELDNKKIIEINYLIDIAQFGYLNENRIRAEITYPDGKIVYMDANGGLEVGLEQKRLSNRDLQRVNSLLKLMTTEKIWENNSHATILELLKSR